MTFTLLRTNHLLKGIEIKIMTFSHQRFEKTSVCELLKTRTWGCIYIWKSNIYTW